MPEEPEQNQEQGEQTPNQQEPTQDPGPESFETWYVSQSEPVKGLVDGQIRGLKAALKSERETRKELEKQVRELAGRAEKGSELEKQLTEAADKMVATDKKADFYEVAHSAGVSNLKLAWQVVQLDELYDRRGDPDFDALKKSYPELFKTATRTPGDAGKGTTEPPSPKQGMNAFIRAASGRG